MTKVASQMPVVEQDPTDADFVANPYAFYSRLRALGDLVYWQDYEMAVATTHTAVNHVMRHAGMGRQVPNSSGVAARKGLETWSALEAHSLLEIEPPEHTRIRREAARAFVGPQIAAVAPAISRYADGLISEFPETPFDLIEAYAKPLAALTITEFLGIAPEHAPQLQAWSNQMVAMYQARRDAQVEASAEQASRAFVSFMRDTLATRKTAPRGDILSELVASESRGMLSEEELISTAILLLNAGHEATAHTLGNAVPLLLAFEGRFEALAPDSIAGTVEECLRFRPPLHLFNRHVYQPCVLEGVSLDVGDQIGCLLGSACHDDAVWPDASRFDPFRSRRPHLAFGVGLHRCIGAALARLELQIALPALFSRCPEITLVGEPRVANLYHFHGYERLTVSIKAATPQST